MKVKFLLQIEEKENKENLISHSLLKELFMFFCESNNLILTCVCGRESKYHELKHGKFGEEGNKYFRHATGQIYAISKDLATYISINW